jgi:hypothetical protein
VGLPRRNQKWAGKLAGLLKPGKGIGKAWQGWDAVWDIGGWLG